MVGMPSADQLITIAQLGGFVFASIVLLLILRTLFDTWRKGDLISKVDHERVVKQLTDANAALRADLRASATELGRLADAVEHLGDRLQQHDANVRERIASLGAGRNQPT